MPVTELHNKLGIKLYSVMTYTVIIKSSFRIYGRILATVRI